MIINIPDDWLPTSENLNALPEPLRKYIHDLHTASDNATLVRQEALTRTEYKILRKMIEDAPERVIDGKRVKLLEVGDE